MSRAYLLEEVALNIRARGKYNIQDEYYAGEYMPELLVKLFRDTYSVSVATLAEDVELDSSTFKINMWRNGRWELM